MRGFAISDLQFAIWEPLAAELGEAAVREMLGPHSAARRVRVIRAGGRRILSRRV